MKSPGRRWENLRIALKLAVSFAAILIIVITLGTLAVARLSTLAQNSRDISRTSMPSITHLSAMAIAQWSVRTAEFREVVSMSNDEASKYIQLEGERMATFERERQAADRLLTDDHERQLWARYAQQWSLYLELKARVSDMMLHGQKEQAQQLLYAQGRTLFDASLATLQELITHNVEEGNERADESDVIYHNARLLIIAMIAAATLIGTVVSMLAARGIVRPVREAITIFNSIAGGRLDNRIDTGRTDEIGELLRNLDGMQSQLRSQIGAERAAAAENVRIRQALDKVSRSVVLADRDQKIIYLNEAARRNFSETQPQIRRVIPGFDADSLQGASVDALAADPAGQHEMLASLSSSHSEERELGECTFQVVTNPVVDSSGARLGTVMEWTNRTQQVSVEREMKQMLAAVVGGDLSRRIDVAGKAGFFRDMSVGVNELANSLGQIVSKAKDVALGVHRGAEEISAGNVSLSQRTESQAASLEETASSMEQMTSTVKQNADNASEANQLASAARDLAERGGTVVANAVDAMGQISASSSKIADIISVIDEIAFQTNLLALNAAVEAARAGEQGRGFAVVATEVRSLASRSATAAKQIKELIEDSLKKVADGSALVIQSGSSLNEIVRAVKQVSDIVAEIAAASREQSSGIEQVNKAMMQMDESTQQNAALVEQATAASQALADQAQELKALMENYNVSSQGQQWSARASVSDGEPVIQLRRAS